MDELFKVVTTPSGDGGTVTIFRREDQQDGGFEMVPVVTVILGFRTPLNDDGVLVQSEPDGQEVYRA